MLYLKHDAREARALLESPQARDVLGGERRVACGLNGITVFLDPDEIARLFRDLYDWVAPGSKHSTKTCPGDSRLSGHVRDSCQAAQAVQARLDPLW